MHISEQGIKKFVLIGVTQGFPLWYKYEAKYELMLDKQYFEPNIYNK